MGESFATSPSDERSRLPRRRAMSSGAPGFALSAMISRTRAATEVGVDDAFDRVAPVVGISGFESAAGEGAHRLWPRARSQLCAAIAGGETCGSMRSPCAFTSRRAPRIEPECVL